MILKEEYIRHVLLFLVLYCITILYVTQFFTRGVFNRSRVNCLQVLAKICVPGIWNFGEISQAQHLRFLGHLSRN